MLYSSQMAYNPPINLLIWIPQNFRFMWVNKQKKLSEIFSLTKNISDCLIEMLFLLWDLLMGLGRPTNFKLLLQKKESNWSQEMKYLFKKSLAFFLIKKHLISLKKIKILFWLISQMRLNPPFTTQMKTLVFWLKTSY